MRQFRHIFEQSAVNKNFELQEKYGESSVHNPTPQALFATHRTPASSNRSVSSRYLTKRLRKYRMLVRLHSPRSTHNTKDGYTNLCLDWHLLNFGSTKYCNLLITEYKAKSMLSTLLWVIFKPARTVNTARKEEGNKNR
jgi:hypothetical protein